MTDRVRGYVSRLGHPLTKADLSCKQTLPFRLSATSWGWMCIVTRLRPVSTMHTGSYRAAFSAHDAGRLHRFIDHVRAHFGEPRCCYEASSCGYVLYRSLHEMGVDCEVIAPGSLPRRTSDQIKTDRRDAKMLAEYFAAGLLTACFVPDQSWESARNLVRSRADLLRGAASRARCAHSNCSDPGGMYTTPVRRGRRSS